MSEIIHQLAYVEDLNGPWLFESMYAEDPEASKLAALPGMQDLLQAYPFINSSTENSLKLSPILAFALSSLDNYNLFLPTKLSYKINVI